LVDREHKADDHDAAGELIGGKGKKVRRTMLALMEKAGVTEVQVDPDELTTSLFAQDVVDPATGELLAEVNTPVTDRIKVLEEKNIGTIEVFFPEDDPGGTIISETLKKDTLKTPEEALVEIYRRLRPGDPATVESCRGIIEGMFFVSERY